VFAARKPGLEFAVGRRDDKGEGDVSLGLYTGVGGHSGLVGSSIGLEMLGRAEPWEDFEDGPLPLMDSVSLPHEKDRDVLVTCTAFFPGEFGGV
jgi:hypothetical protein